MSIIETKDLTKKFRDLVAVDHVSLAIEAGECFGLLGPNGAGKTSLIRMIIGVSPPNEGTVRVLGGDPNDSAGRVRAALGVAPQLDNLDPDLTVLQNLTTFARYFDIPRAEARRRAEEVLTLFELTGKSKSQIRELSGGMKRRLILARSLINRPKSWSLTSRPSGLTRRRGTSSGTSSRSYGRRAPPSSCALRTWRRPRFSATGWPSCTRAES